MNYVIQLLFKNLELFEVLQTFKVKLDILFLVFYDSWKISDEILI